MKISMYKQLKNLKKPKKCIRELMYFLWEGLIGEMGRWGIGELGVGVLRSVSD